MRKMLFNSVLFLFVLSNIAFAVDNDIFQVTIRTTNIGRVKYRDGELILSQNQQKITDIFFTPFPYISSNLTECHENELSGYTELVLAVELYNDEIINTVHTYLDRYHPSLCNTNKTTHNLSSYCHVSLLPMNEIRIVRTGQIKASAQLKYILDNEWIPNSMLLQTIKFPIYTDNMNTCERIQRILTTQCRISHFEVQYSLRGEQNIARQLNVTSEHVRSTSMYNGIIAKFPNLITQPNEVVALTGEDMKKLASETKDRVTMHLRVQEGYDSLTDPLSIENILVEQLKYKQTYLSEYTDKLWENLYWTSEVTRPDQLAKVINSIIRKDSKNNDRYIYDHHAATIFDKKNLKQHDIDRIEKLDEYLKKYDNNSKSIDNDKSSDSAKGEVGWKDIFSASGDSNSESTHEKHREQDVQSSIDSHRHRLTDKDHLNSTKIKSNNDTVKTLSRHQVDGYLSRLSQHIHLEGNIIKPRPITVDLVKLGSLNFRSGIFSSTVLVKTRTNVYKAPIRCSDQHVSKSNFKQNSDSNLINLKITKLTNDITRLESLLTEGSSKSVETLSKLKTDIDKILSRITTVESNVTNSQQKTTLSVNDVLYIGEIRLFASSNLIPTNWLLCDGSEISRYTYSQLYNIIGLKYGTASSSLRFKLPDLRNRFPMGASSSRLLGSTGGNDKHILDIDEMPIHSHHGGSLNTKSAGAHTHGIADPGHDHPFHQRAGFRLGHLHERTKEFGVEAPPVGGLPSYLDRAHTGISLHHAGDHVHAIHGQTGKTGEGNSFSLLSPYQTVNYIIYAGITSQKSSYVWDFN
ncbi:hypothetical protein I4U23_022551 [Adineta vaga]|nr:hypothetical protein I4U23_022551 [Adineta vaga]